MGNIIHINTFYGEEAEIVKMDILDALEDKFGLTVDVVQVFEDPENELDGFDLFLRYPADTELDFEFLKNLVEESELYILVYDLKNKKQQGFWYDEQDYWISSDLSDETLNRVANIF